MPGDEVEYTRPATRDDVKTLVRLLHEHGAAYAPVGGYSLAARGCVRFTEDVDVLVDPSPENAQRRIAALSRLPDGAAGELAGEPDVFGDTGLHAVRVNDEFTVDVLPAARGHPWDELRAYAEDLEIDGVAMRVLTLEGLLLTKEGDRDKDRADRRLLLAALRALGRQQPPSCGSPAIARASASDGPTDIFFFPSARWLRTGRTGGPTTTTAIGGSRVIRDDLLNVRNVEMSTS